MCFMIRAKRISSSLVRAMSRKNYFLFVTFHVPPSWPTLHNVSAALAILMKDFFANYASNFPTHPSPPLFKDSSSEVYLLFLD